MEAKTRNVTIPSNHEYFLTADMTPVIIAADHVTSNAKNATKNEFQTYFRSSDRTFS